MSCTPLNPLNLALNVPSGFPQILHSRLSVFQPIAPKVFDSVPNIESHMFRDLYALHAGWMACIVFRMIYRVIFHFLALLCSKSTVSSSFTADSRPLFASTMPR